MNGRSVRFTRCIALFTAASATIALGACADVVGGTPPLGTESGLNDPHYNDAYNQSQTTPTPVPSVPSSVPGSVGPAEGCPAHEPSEHDVCHVPGRTCEYGTSPDSACNRHFICDANVGTWLERGDEACPVAQCPAPGAISALDGAPCAVPKTDAGGSPGVVDELVCPMVDGVCACTTGVDGAHLHTRRWVCITPSTTCPTRRPLVGQLCQASPETCDYGACAFRRGVAMTCTDGTWSEATTVCPDQ
jgi:hypothetical protein